MDEASPPAPAASPPPTQPRRAVHPDVDRVAISAFLEQPARLAIKRRDHTRAVALYRGLVAARGAGDRAALDLAQAWTLVGRYDEAGEVLDAFLANSQDRALIGRARAERERVGKARLFFDREFVLQPATAEARRCFALGRRAFRKQRFAEALAYYEMGHALAPDMPGFLRELGATYDRLGARSERVAFHTRYLQSRPLGKNADYVRKQLEQVNAPLGSLDVSSSLPCDEFWLAGTSGTSLPIKALKLPPGRFKALCVSFVHELAYFEYVTIQPRQVTRLTFRWAVVENKLRDPLGRIRIEDARSGDLIDLGVSSPAIGVVVPADDRALRVELVAEDGTRRESRYLRLSPGGRYDVRW